MGIVFKGVIMLCMTCMISSVRVAVNVKSNGLPRFAYQIHQPIKLPVWPVWSGVIAQCFDWLKSPSVSESIISTIGGRVVPITLSSLDVSPFLLLAHHTHSFTPLDPVRAATKFFLPEGFPAHPHSGFDTVTYCIEGGLRHRDSEGIKMSYCDGDVQWMRAGRGVIHEEMWDLREADWKHKKIEIFQLWVNLPAKSKSLSPSLHVLKSEAIPVIDCGKGVSIKVICGSLLDVSHASGAIESEELARENMETPQNEITTDGPGSKVCESPVSILHASMSEAHSTLDLSTDMDCTMTVYVRRGSMILDDVGKTEIRAGDCVIYRQSASDTARRGTEQGTVSLTAGASGLDALLLTGKPLNERVIWQGPLVMADEESFRRSAEGFNSIGARGYWDHNIPDEEWAEHVRTLDLQNLISAANAYAEAGLR